MGDIDAKIKSINDKIRKEELMRQAAVRVKSQTSNTTVQTQCESNIENASRYIEYLTKEMEKLQLKQRNSFSTTPQSQRNSQIDYYQQSPTMSPQVISHSPYSYPISQNQPTTNSIPYGQQHPQCLLLSTTTPRSPLTNLDLIKSNTPITTQKVALKLHELQFKLDVERKLKEGSEKLINAVHFQDPKNKKSIAEVQEKTLESKEKISILTRSLQKYRQLYIGEVDDDEEDDSERASRNTPGIRRPVTGKLSIRILHARHISHTPTTRSSKHLDTTVTIKIDGMLKNKTRVSRNDRWNEDFEIHVDKASEVEITLYDKLHEHHQVPVGLLWIKISDIAEELRKKRIEAENGPGWVTASNAQFEMQGSPTSTINTTPLNNSQNPADPYSIPYVAAKPQQGTEASVLSDGIEAWFEVEPAGQISLMLNFEKESVNKRPLELGRQGALRKRKGDILEQNGHKFIQKIFYQVMKCAYCEELFVNEGFQCDDCKLTCHKRCYTKIVTKCIAKSNAEMDSDYKQLSHRIPHRFDNLTNIYANWCCHCGYILPIGKKGSKRCSECTITCHAKCAHLVPDFCGMSMRLASEMIDQINAKFARDNIANPSSTHQQPQIDKVEPVVVHKTPKIGLDDFTFISVLGKGNFGKVMLAEEKTTKKLYAIKVLKKEFIIENDEYVSGGDLMLHIQREQFTYRRAQFYAAEVLLALEYLHKHGIIYRDLKLDNILLTLDGHIKIADYGLCKEEMWFGCTTNTFCAVDWWAFGVLIYEMLLGQSPFRGDDEDEIFDAILEDEILYPINMSRDSVSILQKKRLGTSIADAEEIKKHPFFKGVNWNDMLAKKVPPPFYPTISCPTDTSNFDEEFTKEVPVLTPVQTQLGSEEQEEFRGFSYISNWIANPEN
nr:15778_t:CDS:10 [Entrophospora candida]